MNGQVDREMLQLEIPGCHMPYALSMPDTAGFCENCGTSVFDFTPTNSTEMFMQKQMHTFKELLLANKTGDEET